MKYIPRNVAHLGTGHGIRENLLVQVGLTCFPRRARYLALFLEPTPPASRCLPGQPPLSLPAGKIELPGWLPILISDFYLFFRTTLFSRFAWHLTRNNAHNTLIILHIIPCKWGHFVIFLSCK